ncbi:ABC transporter ATP-binding protein [Pseudobdellovibrio sp. HCB154]|uniref:ABC transporter ATP-binding protein n=1 Tax=Pseudobdellovibrio sp. HCB154 TaxID=3386277 RepID=UPI00391726A5
MIEVNNLCKNYGERKAIQDINFKISAGDVVGLLGPNGAGKSTTMKIITGFMAPTSGMAKVCGFDVFENPFEVKKRIGYLPEAPPVYLDMNVGDYLNFVADLKLVDSAKKKAFVEKALQKTQLTDVKNRLIKNLSKGFRQRVGIAQALVSDPEVLVLDEPTVGLDPKQVAEVRDLIKELKGQHTIILSTHILPEVQATCNRVIIIHQGRIVAEDSIDNIEKLNQGLVTVYVKTKKEMTIATDLRNLTGVETVEVTGATSFKIQVKDEDILDNVASHIIKSGAGLRELTPAKENLEDVFLKLTYGENKEHV